MALASIHGKMEIFIMVTMLKICEVDMDKCSGMMAHFIKGNGWMISKMEKGFIFPKSKE